MQSLPIFKVHTVGWQERPDLQILDSKENDVDNLNQHFFLYCRFFRKQKNQKKQMKIFKPKGLESFGGFSRYKYPFTT